MDYKKYPGKNRIEYGKLLNKNNPVISIVTPYYNSDKTIEETFNSIMNQTYPYFEWIIVDDGSKEETTEILKELEKKDSRVKTYRIDNSGPAYARDYGIDKANESSKYIYFLDSDDLIDKTTLEVLYWTLETHKDASFAYATTVNFGTKEYCWEKYFTIEEEKDDNLLTIAALVRKDALLEVGCFGIKEKSVYEDWNLWLKLIAKNHKPIRVSAPLFWYRHEEEGELSRSNNDTNNAMKYVTETRKNIPNDLFKAIQYPRVENHEEYNYNMILPRYDVEKELNIVTILNDSSVEFSNDNTITISTLPTIDDNRTLYKGDVYDLSSFIDRIDYIKFIDYLIESRNIKEINIYDNIFGYYIYTEIKDKYPKIIINFNMKKEMLFDNKYQEEVENYYKNKFDIDINNPPKNIVRNKKTKNFIERIKAKNEWKWITKFPDSIKNFFIELINIIKSIILFIISIISITIKCIIRILGKPFRK